MYAMSVILFYSFILCYLIIICITFIIQLIVLSVLYSGINRWTTLYDSVVTV